VLQFFKTAAQLYKNWPKYQHFGVHGIAAPVILRVEEPSQCFDLSNTVVPYFCPNFTPSVAHPSRFLTGTSIGLICYERATPSPYAHPPLSLQVCGTLSTLPVSLVNLSMLKLSRSNIPPGTRTVFADVQSLASLQILTVFSLLFFQRSPASHPFCGEPTF